jgi:hypothetical protein
MTLSELIPMIKAILGNEDLPNIAKYEHIDLVDFLLESDYDILKRDLKAFELLNTMTIEERESYITLNYDFGSYFDFKNLGIHAGIGNSASYLSVVYNWKKNTVHIHHIMCDSLSNVLYFSDFIALIREWITYLETGFLSEPPQ